MNNLEKTEYTGKYLDFIGDESFLILLTLAKVPETVVHLYKLIKHPQTPIHEKNVALATVKRMGYGEEKIAQIRAMFHSIINQKPETKKIVKPKPKKKKVTPRQYCSGCGNLAKHKLPHNYGGKRRFLYLCDKCLPEIAPIIGHRLTHKPIWDK